MSFKYDNTGISNYSKEDKKRIVEKSLLNLKETYYVSTKIPTDQKLNNLSDEFKQIKNIKIDKNNILKALVYNLYVFGTFKWGKYILVEENDFILDENDEKTKIHLFVYINTDNLGITSGILQSCLSEKISEFVINHNQVENNLIKMLKNHDYKLVDQKTKPYFFGKGHLNLKGDQKISAKRDLNLIFKCMNESKVKIKQSGQQTKLVFPINDMNFFKLEHSKNLIRNEDENNFNRNLNKV